MSSGVPPAGVSSPASLIAGLTARLARATRRTRILADAEAIHDTRVTLRRLEAILDVWRDALRPRRRRRARRALRGLRRSLGAAREAEVNATLLRTRLSTDASGPPADLRIALARLERREDRARRRAARVCRREAVDVALRRLRRAWRPTLHARPPADGELMVAARSRVGHRAAVARATLAEAVRSGDQECLHRARITLKRWRYGLDALAGGDAGLAGAPRERIEQVQGSLGALHDLVVLRATLQELSSEFAPRGLRAEAPLGGMIAALDLEFRHELAVLAERAASLTAGPLALATQRPAASSTRG
jgi:CHAD domain-containing protein